MGLSYGTNDANGCASTTTFYDNYVTMVQTVLNLGKVPVVPTIPWAKSANVQSCGPGFNTKIQALYTAFPQIVKGPDLWTYFKANPSLISSDGLHPSSAGYAGFRQQWASAMLANVYTSGPSVSLTPTSLSFAAQRVGTTSAAQTSTLRNTGTAPLTIGGIAISGAAAADYARTNDCPLAPATLAAGASCTISVSFSPTATGTRAAAVTITDDASGSPHSLALAGTATAPAAALAPTSVAFASRPVGSTSGEEDVTLTDTGNAALAIGSIAVSGTDAADFSESDHCPATLAPGASCTIALTFTPDREGDLSASLTVSDDAAGSPQAAALTGIGVAPAPAVTLSPAALAFGSRPVGSTSAAQTAALRNAGSAPLTISAIDVAGAEAGDFAESDDCPKAPATLAPAAACTLALTFTPTAGGGRAASVSIADDAADTPQALALSGIGAQPTPAVSLSPASVAFGGQRVGTTSATQSVTLTNSGTADLTIAGVAVSGANAGDFAESDDCPVSPATLGPGAGCTIQVGFTPIAAGSRAAAVTISDDAPGGPQTAALTGTGTQPAVTLTPGSLTFSSQTVGTTSAAQTVTVRNSGTAPLAISSILVGGTNAGDFAQTNTCPLVPSLLAANATCTISATFRPTATGTRSASITLTDDAPNGMQTIALNGTGAPGAPAVTLSPTTLAFGSQAVNTSSAPQTTTLRNSGTGPLTISTIALVGTNATSYTQTNTCPISPATLAAGATCTATVTFKPTGTGTRNATLRFTDNASGSPHNVSLTGTGVTPTVTLTPTTLTFASQAVGTTSASQTSTLRNTGTTALTISSIAVTGTSAGDYARTTTCPISPATLAASATCTITVTFSPSASGIRTAAVTVTDNGTGSPHTLSLTGTGTTAAGVTLTPSGLGFGPQPVGTTSAAQNATLRNSSPAPLTITSIGITGTNSVDFAETSDCPTSPSTLAAGASCTISVTFTPSAAGSRTASVSVADDASGSPHTVGLSGTGTQPAVTLTPASLAFGAQTVGTSSAVQSATVRNSGTAPLAISSILIGGTNAGDFAQTNNCPTVPSLLAANATCTISVTFKPLGTGARSATVTIGDDAAGSPHGIPLGGTGSAAGAIALDKNLGTKTDNVASNNITLNTTAAAAAGSRVFVFVDWTQSTRTLSSVTGGGLTWTIDVQAKASNSIIRQAIASAPAPAGLPGNTVIQATFSGSVGHGLVSAVSFMGITTAAPLDTTASSTQAGVTNWACTLTTTNPNDLVLGWSTIDANATSTATAPSIEIHDFGDANYYGWATSVYRTETTGGVKTVNGTWSSNSLSSSNITVCAAYKAG